MRRPARHGQPDHPLRLRCEMQRVHEAGPAVGGQPQPRAAPDSISEPRPARPDHAKCGRERCGGVSLLRGGKGQSSSGGSDGRINAGDGFVQVQNHPRHAGPRGEFAGVCGLSARRECRSSSSASAASGSVAKCARCFSKSVVSDCRLRPRAVARAERLPKGPRDALRRVGRAFLHDARRKGARGFDVGRIVQQHERLLRDVRADALRGAFLAARRVEGEQARMHDRCAATRCRGRAATGLRPCSARHSRTGKVQILPISRGLIRLHARAADLAARAGRRSPARCRARTPHPAGTATCRASSRLSGSRCVHLRRTARALPIGALVTISRTMCFTSQPLSTNSQASQSSSAGFTGGSPCAPKSSSTLERPVPKNSFHSRFEARAPSADFPAPPAILARSSRVNRRSFTPGCGRNAGTPGSTTSPVSSSQLPRGRIRTVRGVAVDSETRQRASSFSKALRALRASAISARTFSSAGAMLR